ncbi:hypothetical protein NXS19_000018, partial [Fusarium pseudograminearum]
MISPIALPIDALNPEWSAQTFRCYVILGWRHSTLQVVHPRRRSHIQENLSTYRDYVSAPLVVRLGRVQVGEIATIRR